MDAVTAEPEAAPAADEATAVRMNKPYESPSRLTYRDAEDDDTGFAADDLEIQE